MQHMVAPLFWQGDTVYVSCDGVRDTMICNRGLSVCGIQSEYSYKEKGKHYEKKHSVIFSMYDVLFLCPYGSNGARGGCG